MRINKYVALATGMSRRAADKALKGGRVTINEKITDVGAEVSLDDTVALDGQTIQINEPITTVLINKPVGYVCSRDGQGSQTIYDLLPPELHHLKPIGRLDKNSSGLLLMTNDGKLAHELTHPSFKKEKVYQVGLNKPLSETDKTKIRTGVKLEDGLSSLQISPVSTDSKLPNTTYMVRMSEGRNRQIRRTFSVLDYEVTQLHRIQFGNYKINDLKPSKYKYL